MESVVIVRKGRDPYDTTKEALLQSSFPDIRGRKVLIKPNAARVAFPGQGVTTHPGVVEAVIDHLRETGVREIAIGESCIFGVDPEEAFRSTGMKEVSENKEVALIDLDWFPPLELRIPEGNVLRRIKVSSIIGSFDFLISIPVMKTHMHTRVTLSIKNMKGVLWRGEKARLHQIRYDQKATHGEKALDIALSDMAMVLLPHFAIIDGITGMEGMGPAYGKRKEAGLIVIGANPVSVDAVASELMGFPPMEVPHLRLIAEKGLGEIRLSKILIQPEDYQKWKTQFEPSPKKLSLIHPDVVIHDGGACSGCLSTLMLLLNPPFGELLRYRSGDGKVHIGVGKFFREPPRETIFIGNCAKKRNRGGLFVPGCPPVTSSILSLLGNRI